MKKYLSVFNLFARGSLYKVLICFILMVSAEAILFSIKLNETLNLYYSGFQLNQLETVIDNSLIELIFTVCFILITWILSVMGTEYGNVQTSYTIRRLQISERKYFLCQATYNSLIYIIFWAVQTFTVFILCTVYIYSAPENMVGNQTLFLAFYRNGLLHSLMPISDIGLWIRNIILAIGMGFTTAEFPYKQRRKKFGATVIAYGLYIIIFFTMELSDTFNLFLTTIVSIIIIGETLYTMLIEDEEVATSGKNQKD